MQTTLNSSLETFIYLATTYLYFLSWQISNYYNHKQVHPVQVTSPHTKATLRSYRTVCVGATRGLTERWRERGPNLGIKWWSITSAGRNPDFTTVWLLLQLLLWGEHQDLLLHRAHHATSSVISGGPFSTTDATSATAFSGTAGTRASIVADGNFTAAITTRTDAALSFNAAGETISRSVTFLSSSTTTATTAAGGLVFCCLLREKERGREYRWVNQRLTGCTQALGQRNPIGTGGIGKASLSIYNLPDKQAHVFCTLLPLCKLFTLPGGDAQ